MECETISTPDLVNLANQLTHTPDDSTKRKINKFLIFSSGQWKPLQKTKTMITISVTIAKSPFV